MVRPFGDSPVFRWRGGFVSLLMACAMAVAQQAPPGQKVIKDPAEYNAYTAASNTQDATARAEAFAAFVQQYPHSAVLTDALDQEMAAWQQAGDSGQVKRVAKSLLDVDAGNIRAMGIVVALDRVSAEKGDQAALNEMCVDATGGMREVPMWHKPAEHDRRRLCDTEQADEQYLHRRGRVLRGPGKKLFAGERMADPRMKIDPTNVQDAYQLAMAELE